MGCQVDVNPNRCVIKILSAMSDDYMCDIREAFEDALDLDVHIIVDLTGASFVSSSGLGLLFNSNTKLATHGKKLIVAGANDELRRLFSVTRIENHVTLCANVEEAIALVDSGL